MSSSPALQSPTVALALTGSIAAYKAVEVCRVLLKAGVQVLPLMTRAATKFVGPATLSGLCGRPVCVDMFAEASEAHVAIADRADVIAIVPASAQLLSDLAQGKANDVVRATALCAEGLVMVAPAMHPRMWAHKATQRNVRQLVEDGVQFIGPVSGLVASGDVGLGRLAEPSVIAAAILSACFEGNLTGLHIVVSAGPTVEDVDPARYLSNRSSGKMGYAMARRAAARGAKVTLVSGPVNLSTPMGVERVQVRSATQMLAALQRVLGAGLKQADALIMAAAVADFRPVSIHNSKIKREAKAERVLNLVANPDLLKSLSEARGSNTKPLLVGFALETARGEALIQLARGKLERKGVDIVVANHADDAFDGDQNKVTIVDAQSATELPMMDKHAAADKILDRLLDRVKHD